jgi:hypothetical protein
LGRSWWSAPLLGLAAGAVVACGSLLEVENPNNVKGEDITRPAAGTALANGVQALTAHGVNAASLVYHAATDELAWKGSRDGWRELDQGQISNAYNEFTDGTYRTTEGVNGNLSEARWEADEAVKILEAQDADGSIADRADLARVYFYGAIAYTTIADIYDDWVLSDRRTPGMPTGPDNMGSYYDTAADYLTKGLAIATAVNNSELTVAIRAMRARAYFDHAIWETVNPARAGAGLVNSTSPHVAAAVSDANAALALMSGNPDYEYRFTFSVNTGASAHGQWIASRQEMRLGGTYVKLHPTDPTWLDSVVLRDPIDNSRSQIVDKIQKRIRAEKTYAGYTVVSAREMHLILAEAALAAGDVPGFQTAINNLRDLDGLPDWTPASGVTAQGMLVYSREANLFLQTRRLSDEYRFGVPSPEWLSGAQLLTSPGMFFPIPATECLSNPNITAEKCST